MELDSWCVFLNEFSKIPMWGEGQYLGVDNHPGWGILDSLTGHRGW